MEKRAQRVQFTQRNITPTVILAFTVERIQSCCQKKTRTFWGSKHRVLLAGDRTLVSWGSLQQPGLPNWI